VQFKRTLALGCLDPESRLKGEAEASRNIGTLDRGADHRLAAWPRQAQGGRACPSDDADRAALAPDLFDVAQPSASIAGQGKAPQPISVVRDIPQVKGVQAEKHRGPHPSSLRSRDLRHSSDRK
jgi:hypothetical protein